MLDTSPTHVTLPSGLAKRDLPHSTNAPTSTMESGGESATALLPIMVVVLIAFLIIGFALPVLPLHVHQGLGLSTFVVGLVTGTQFTAAIISRVWSGRYADRRGAKRAVVAGLLTAIVSGLLYLLSLRFVDAPWVSVTFLLIARALLGGAESFIITGAVTWGLALVGPQRAGRVIAWMGMAMFAAFAVGAPVGTSLYFHGGFAAVAVATTLVPLGTLLVVAPLASVPPQHGARPHLMKVIRSVWMPGLGSAAASDLAQFSPSAHSSRQSVVGAQCGLPSAPLRCLWCWLAHS
jgi:MFS family permease